MLQASDQLITIGGLPLHPLAVHAAVVLLPLGVVGVMAVILVPKWRRHYAILALLVLVAGVGATVVAEQAGEQLALVTGITEEHRKLGKLMAIASIAMLGFAAVWFWPQRNETKLPRKRLGTGLEFIAAAGSLALGAASIILIALVGHSGATAVWQNKIAAPTPAATATSSSSSSSGDYTLANVAKHNSSSDCWSVINGNVYDLTNWITRHPGGARVIEGLCGIDGSAAFTGQHGNQGGPNQYLATFKLGALKK